MNSSIKVSVVVPCFNHQASIKQCLDSILDQNTDFNYEILVGDDLSTDNTRNILQEYQKKHPSKIKVYFREENLGPTLNAAKLLKEAEGEYIAYLEGDDYWCDSSKLQLQSNYLDNHRDCIACFHPVYIVDENGKKLHRKLYWIKHKKRYSYSDFDGLRLPGHSSSWLRRNIIKNSKINYEEFLSINPKIADRTSALFFLNSGEFAMINRTMGCYRYTRTNGITSSEYSDAISALHNEYHFARSLESLAKNELKNPISLAKQYRRLYLKSLLLMLTNNSIELKQLSNQLWNTVSNKTITVLSLPFNFVFMIYKKIFYLE